MSTSLFSFQFHWKDIDSLNQSVKWWVLLLLWQRMGLCVSVVEAMAIIQNQEFFYFFGSNYCMIDSFVTLEKDGIADFNGDGKGSNPKWRILFFKESESEKNWKCECYQNTFKNPKTLN